MADSELKSVTLLTSHQGRLFAYVLSLVGDILIKLVTSGRKRMRFFGGLWEGRIDQLALFDKTLSPEQIKSLYEAARQR